MTNSIVQLSGITVMNMNRSAEGCSFGHSQHVSIFPSRALHGSSVGLTHLFDSPHMPQTFCGFLPEAGNMC